MSVEWVLDCCFFNNGKRSEGTRQKQKYLKFISNPLITHQSVINYCLVNGNLTVIYIYIYMYKQNSIPLNCKVFKTSDVFTASAEQIIDSVLNYRLSTIGFLPPFNNNPQDNLPKKQIIMKKSF